MADQFTSNFTRTALSRQARLRGWLMDQGLTLSEVSRRMGISIRGASLLCRAETVPIHRREQLRALGIPDELLPEGHVVRFGPKPKDDGALEA